MAPKGSKRPKKTGPIAYQAFWRARKDEIEKKYPDDSVREKAGELWKNLGEKEKAEWQEKAENALKAKKESEGTTRKATKRPGDNKRGRPAKAKKVDDDAAADESSAVEDE